MRGEACSWQRLVGQMGMQGKTCCRQKSTTNGCEAGSRAKSKANPLRSLCRRSAFLVVVGSEVR